MMNAINVIKTMPTGGSQWLLRLSVCVIAFHISLIKVFTQTIDSTYNHFFLEAMVQRQKGHHDAAFDLLRHCRDLNPNAPEVYYFLGQYYAALKQQDESMACVKKAAELDPENTTYMETLAQAYISRQDYASAIPVIKGIYERDKNQEDMLEMLFQLYQQVEDYDTAICVLNQLEQNDGKNERLSVAKCALYNRLGKNKEAVKEMAALARQYPNDLNYKARDFMGLFIVSIQDTNHKPVD